MALHCLLTQASLSGLIGPNGAGKTTAFNLLTGVYAPTSGKIEFDGLSMVGRKPHQIAASGLSRTFQNIRLFPTLTVLDNVRTAGHMHYSPSLWDAVWRGPKFAGAETATLDESRDLLNRFGLLKYENEFARNLAYGEQRRLEIARALATKPKLLLLDEPAAGMNPQEKNDLMRQIESLRDDFGLTILLIEHDMKVVMGICRADLGSGLRPDHRAGTPREIRENPKVIEAYLGEADAAAECGLMLILENVQVSTAQSAPCRMSRWKSMQAKS